MLIENEYEFDEKRILAHTFAVLYQILTDVFKHFVALIKNEHLQIVKVESLVLGQVQDTAWCSHDYVRSVRTLEQLFLFFK